MNNTASRGPSGFRLQSSSPVLGCLFTMFALIAGLAVAMAGFLLALIMPVVLLIMRLVGKALGKPAEVQVRPSDVAVIDVESTVLPPGPERQEQ